MITIAVQTLYNKEAESYDRALMETWKDNMGSIIIFVRMQSRSLVGTQVLKLKFYSIKLVSFLQF